ncbi:KilA-N domain-containing protein [Paludibacterium sp. B53371]|uniref:KilA-N domain-containing protein n=1 Tax=Paludibacterium sp. B53371 TaxID=2806263 RepID=UPI001C05A5B0|nr:KilA-N domain-containing protein [Paludibacterium sp. B53371]
MNHVSTINPTISNDSIIIGGFPLRRDEQGRYCINDLHKAAGGEEKHQPAFFMRRNETNDLLAELANSANSQNKQPAESKAGRYGGTYVCKELVYALRHVGQSGL